MAASHDGPIHLVLSDMRLPVVDGGRVLADLHRRWPGVRMLYMSVVPRQMLLEDGRIPHGVASLEKPFTCAHLLERVRWVLDPA